MSVTADELIRLLGLQRNPEGGFFRQYYSASIAHADERPAATVIYYLITSQSPVGYLHRMTADSVHFFHLGSPLRVLLLDPEGCLESVNMGPDVLAGHQLQCVVKAGFWKAFELTAGDYALISEAVCPGWRLSDQESAGPDLVSQFPHLKEQIVKFIRSHDHR